MIAMIGHAHQQSHHYATASTLCLMQGHIKNRACRELPVQQLSHKLELHLSTAQLLAQHPLQMQVCWVASVNQSCASLTLRFSSTSCSFAFCSSLSVWYLLKSSEALVPLAGRPGTSGSSVMLPPPKAEWSLAARRNRMEKYLHAPAPSRWRNDVKRRFSKPGRVQLDHQSFSTLCTCPSIPSLLLVPISNPSQRACTPPSPPPRCSPSPLHNCSLLVPS